MDCVDHNGDRPLAFGMAGIGRYLYTGPDLISFFLSGHSRKRGERYTGTIGHVEQRALHHLYGVLLVDFRSAVSAVFGFRDIQRLPIAYVGIAGGSGLISADCTGCGIGFGRSGCGLHF